MSLPDQFANNLEKQLRKTPGFGTLPFTVVLIGLELLMDQGFSCPCTPGLNAVLISFIFLGPALLALTVMMFMRKPCRRKSQNVTELILLSLILPSLWMFLLLFEGEYVACGMAHWEGDYVLDEELQIKWCKPTGMNHAGVNGTELLELTEKISFYSRLSALAVLSVLCISIMTAIIYRDCKNRTLEQLDKRDEPTQQTSLSSSEADVQHPSV
ncbi:uncharacterized protein LOC107653540 [Sinocyclocheilus anshuiensis]|uniref:uncharacterized protein LOC107653540 n=1 Tax=Sinocyclocheilus anshuiensis TaxID=1608454 RepID=UPI0007B82E15|nr:PREDICTED: uncharacterized protein LOC107653540 [Sinocyclocheilus anshuiensis]